jgi:hypothetical protein
MLIQKNRMLYTRIVLISLLIAFMSLWAGTQAYAVTGVEFAAAATEESITLTNSYQDLVALTLNAPKAGYVVLTGSGYLTLTTSPSITQPVWGQVTISIGTVSGASNNENETAVEIPSAEGGGHIYRYPFSITTVIPVKKGANNFYMVGIRDPNTEFSDWSATSLKLTAVFIQKRM